VAVVAGPGHGLGGGGHRRCGLVSQGAIRRRCGVDAGEGCPEEYLPRLRCFEPEQNQKGEEDGERIREKKVE